MVECVDSDKPDDATAAAGNESSGAGTVAVAAGAGGADAAGGGVIAASGMPAVCEDNDGHMESIGMTSQGKLLRVALTEAIKRVKQLSGRHHKSTLAGMVRPHAAVVL
eukprot:m.142944 g.142944  ORF g.142944 m.142944 type:complete len:108 (-) comp14978_c5_seq12:603-926(-)